VVYKPKPPQGFKKMNANLAVCEDYSFTFNGRKNMKPLSKKKAWVLKPKPS